MTLVWVFVGIQIAVAQDVRVNVFTSADEGLPVVAATSTIRVVWADVFEFCGGGSMPTMREVSRRGAFLSGDTMVGATCNVMWGPYAIAMQPSGRFIVATGPPSIPGNVVARVFDSAGMPISGDLAVNQTPYRSIDGPSAAAISNAYAVVWDDTSSGVGGTGGLYGRIVNIDGSMPGAQIAIKAPTPGVTAFFPDVALLASGELVITWIDRNDTDLSYAVVARYFDSTLSPMGSVFPVSQTLGWYTFGAPTVAANGSDYYVIGWELTDPAGSDEDIYARRFSRASGPLGNEFRVNTYTSQAQGEPDAAMDSSGRSVITWTSVQQDGGSGGVYGQRFDASGAALGAEFRINMTTWNPQGDARVAMLPAGDFYVAFGSATGASTDGDVLSRRFFFPISLAIGTGPGAGNGPSVVLSRPDGRAGQPAIVPYSANGYGATVGAGNIDGGLRAEVLTGPGPSPVYGPQVRAFRSDTTPIQKVNYYAYGTLKYGVKEGAGDVDGDGFEEILSAAGPGAVFGPHVRGWNFDNVALSAMAKISFFAYNTLKYGVNVSSGGVDGDSYDEILTAPGPGAAFAPLVRGFNYDNAAVASIGKINFWSFTPGNYGATVSGADVESDGIGGYGDGYDEIVSGRGPAPGNDSALRLYDYDAASVAFKFGVTPYTSMYGVLPSGGDVDAGDTEEIATVPGPDPTAPAHILCWEWNPALGSNVVADLQSIGTDDFVAFPGETYGAHVAVGAFE